jgi:hypothetical protein
MIDDPDTHPFPVGRAAPLRVRARDQIARSRWLCGVARNAQARAASLRIESAAIVDEVRFRQSTRL